MSVHTCLCTCFVQWVKGVARVYYTEALVEHVNCMIVRILEVKGVACYAGAETSTTPVASISLMIATPLIGVLFIMYMRTCVHVHWRRKMV